MIGAQPAPSTTWRSAFPEWELVSEQVPVSGDIVVAETSPEDRVETVLELASAFRIVQDIAVGELYPLVPAQFGLVLEDGGEPVTFASLALRPSADVTVPLSRADGRRLHRTLSQVNAAAAAIHSPSWPQDSVLREVSSAVFALAPERFYALIDVQLRGRDRAAAADYLTREFHDDLDTILDEAVSEARKSADSTEMRHWLDTLISPVGGDALATHPQLQRPLGLLDVTLAQAATLIVPEAGDLTSAVAQTTPADTVEPESSQDRVDRAVAPEAPVHAPAVRTLGLTSDDDLDAWEQALRPRFHDAVLAADADLTAVELEVLLDIYGARYRLSRGRGTTVAQLTHHFPATTLMALVGMASIGLEDNAYWDAFWERLGAERNSTDETALRAQLAPLLEQFNLDPLPGLPASRYVQRLAVHAGVPAASADRLVEVLSTYIGTVSSRDTQPFHDWILQPGQEHVFQQLDYQTRDFVQYSGARGAQLLDEMARVVAEIAEDPAIDAATVDADSTFLPELLLEPLRRALMEADVSESVRSQRRRTRQEPTLHLEPDDSIVVRIPAPASHTSAPWTVTLDTQVLRVTADKFSGDRSVEVPVEHATRRIVVTHPSLRHPIEMRLHDGDDPLVLFTTKGENIPESTRLPRSEIVAVVPGDLHVLGEPPHAPRVTGKFGSPLGWAGWQIQQWDLTETTAVRARTGDRALDLPVGSQPLPGLYDEPHDPLQIIPGVFSEKLPVLAERPWISLPSLGPQTDTTWAIRYRRSGAKEWILQGDYAAPEDGEVPLFDEEPEQLGRFDVRVTGPYGARFETSVFVAEGLEVEYDDTLRLPDRSNLTPVTATVTSATSTLQVLDPSLLFGPTVSKLPLRLRSGSASEVVTVRPPRLEFRMTPVGGVPSWSDRQIGRRPEDFTGATLAVRGVPADVGVTAEVRDHHGSVRGSEKLTTRSRGDVLSITADRLAGSVRQSQSGTVVLQLAYPDATYAAPIIRFNTVGADVRVDLDDDQITVRGRHLHSDTTLHIWKIARPWTPVLTVPLVKGRAQLPASARDAGDLRIAPVVQDDWDPVPPSPLPIPESVRFSRPSTFSDPATAQLSRFLLEKTDAAGIDPVHPEIWSALALLGRELEPGDAERFSELARVVRNEPRRAALSLATSEIDTPDKLALFIRTGLVFYSFQPHGSDNLPAKAYRAALSSEPWLDMLITIADIPSASSHDRVSLRSRLREVGGRALPDILRSGRDPYAVSAALSASLIERSDEPGAIADYLENKRLVPGGLIDPASRYDAYLALFQRKDEDAEVLTDFFAMLVSGDPSPLHEVERFTQLRRTIRARTRKLAKSGNPAWANAPFASLTQCLYARLAAADRIRLAPPRGLDISWSRFAAREPEQTMIDLIVAEAMVTHLNHSGGINPFTAFDSMTDGATVASIVTT